ncbi:MAG: L-cystine uptake protein TcyP (sodium:dicarboxylate symporter family) [Psychromonas sp.]|jgi:L-cystine uptake protein TcyP (sodium:dicarboxylate symporter family)
MSLTKGVLLGMFIGIITGFLIHTFAGDNVFVNEYIVNGFFEVGGKYSPLA